MKRSTEKNYDTWLRTLIGIAVMLTFSLLAALVGAVVLGLFGLFFGVKGVAVGAICIALLSLGFLADNWVR